MSKKKKALKRNKEAVCPTFEYKAFVDCGAPTLYNKLSKKIKQKIIMGSTFKNRKFDSFDYVKMEEYKAYRNAYIEYLQGAKDTVDVYSNLDVINNPKLTWKNQRKLEKAGLNPIPVYHVGTDEYWLEKYIAEYDYVAIGGLVPNRTSVLVPVLDRLFKNHILDKDGFPKVKTHGFACTAFILMDRYPWYSVDSTTCGKLAMFGHIILPEHNDSNRNMIKHLTISSRDVPLEKRLTPGIIRELKRRVHDVGMDLDSMSNHMVERSIWNHLMYSQKIHRQIPKYPWNYYSRESKEGADEMLNFYFANQLSKKDELTFWQALEQHDFALKHRLMSFYYKNMLSNLKYKK